MTSVKSWNNTWRHLVVAVLGGWFVVSPWLLGVAGRPLNVWSPVVLGALALLGSLWLWFGSGTRSWVPWVLAAIGVLLGVSPWLLGASVFPTWGLWADVVAGAAIVAIEGYAAWPRQASSGPLKANHHRAS